uniref:Retrovirus-related Pol polyprotein from transposon TNT 1-94-like beta-barrel domain-containing protein n=1 Tax=Cajanus cajan TaxID=3821 RepID=A0A151U7R7_CAJCA|nr:hypothetical protein KK1_008029 [Cajanus cajan]
MTEGVATQLLHCETSKELWEGAQSLVGAHTRSRVTLLKTEFHSSRKGSMKMEEYLIKMKLLADSLKLAGSPISNTDLITQTLAGLDINYNAIIVQLSDKNDLTWIDMQAQLLTFENRLEQLNSLSSLTLSPSPNVVTRFDQKVNRSNNRGSWRGNNFRGTRGGRGRGRLSRDKPTCQVCEKIGHIAVQCFYRFDKSYMGQSSDDKQEKHNAFIASPNFNASSNSIRDPEWYFDSGASNHVTHDPNQFQEISEHDGKTSLVVGNGERLKIHAYGTAALDTCQRSLNLHDLLYVPKITKNLLSVSKLATDNNITIEFDASDCFVKDKLTGKVLLEGKLRDGLYQLSSVNGKNKRMLHCSVTVRVLYVLQRILSFILDASIFN